MSGLPRSSMSIAVRPGLAPTAKYSPIRIWYLRFDRMTVVTGSFSRAWVHSPAPCTSPSRRPAAPARGARRRRSRASPMRRADRQRHAGADRAAHDLQPVVRRRGVGVPEEAAAVADRLVDDHAPSGSTAAIVVARPSGVGCRARCAGFGPVSGMAAAGAPSSSTSACSAASGVLLDAGEHVQLGAGRGEAGSACPDRRRSRPAARR